MTEPQTDPTLVLDDDPYADGYEEPLPPPRPRRRLVTPVTGALAAVILVAGGFIAGVQVQKHQDTGGAGAGGGAPRAGAFAAAARAGGFSGTARPGAGATQGAADGSQPTVGTVANTHGSTLYLVTSGGTTLRVRPVTGAKVSRTAKTGAAAVHPGDTVIVQGTTAADGTVRATSIQATAANASTGFGALLGAGGGNAAGGTGPPQGFAPPAGG